MTVKRVKKLIFLKKTGVGTKMKYNMKYKNRQRQGMSKAKKSTKKVSGLYLQTKNGRLTRKKTSNRSILIKCKKGRFKFIKLSKIQLNKKIWIYQWMTGGGRPEMRVAKITRIKLKFQLTKGGEVRLKTDSKKIRRKAKIMWKVAM